MKLSVRGADILLPLMPDGHFAGAVVVGGSAARAVLRPLPDVLLREALERTSLHLPAEQTLTPSVAATPSSPVPSDDDVAVEASLELLQPTTCLPTAAGTPVDDLSLLKAWDQLTVRRNRRAAVDITASRPGPVDGGLDGVRRRGDVVLPDAARCGRLSVGAAATSGTLLS